MAGNEPDPDPTREIHDWVRPIPVPEWVAKNAYSECHQCHKKFMPGRKHNCRLCGQLFCSSCSGKYHIPKEYKQKGKAGAVRVCFACRDACLKQKMAAMPVRSRTRRAHTFKKTSRDDDGRLIIHPPEWVKIDAQSDCFKCHAPFTKKKHHCRTCGRLFCSHCTSKLSLPLAFLKKKKPGPARVCDLCRFLISSGAELSSQAPSTERTNKLRLPVRQTKLTVVWDNRQLITEIEDPLCNMTLEEVHQKLIKKRPEMASEVFCYLVKGKPIFKEHWDIFEWEALVPTLFIRKGQFVEYRGGGAKARARKAAQKAAAEKEAAAGGDNDDTTDADAAESEDAGDMAVPSLEDMQRHTRGMTTFARKCSKATKAKPASAPAAAAAPDKEAKTSATPKSKDKEVVVCSALYTYSKPEDPTHLDFNAKDTILVSHRTNPQWWYGYVDLEHKGWFPASYVKLGDDKPVSLLEYFAKHKTPAPALAPAPPAADNADNANASSGLAELPADELANVLPPAAAEDNKDEAGDYVPGPPAPAPAPAATVSAAPAPASSSAAVDPPPGGLTPASSADSSAPTAAAVDATALPPAAVAAAAADADADAGAGTGSDSDSSDTDDDAPPPPPPAVDVSAAANADAKIVSPRTKRGKVIKPPPPPPGGAPPSEPAPVLRSKSGKNLKGALADIEKPKPSKPDMDDLFKRRAMMFRK